MKTPLLCALPICFLFLIGQALADGPATAPAAIDTAKDGVYQQGHWEYRYTISNAGSRSEGFYGRLLLDGREVPEPSAVNDYYSTPWGKLFWVGQPVVAFGVHGWMPTSRPSQPMGRDLPEPLASDGRPVVMLMVLNEDEGANGKNLDPWIAQELAKLQVKGAKAGRAWFRLTEQAVTLHDTKMFGQMRIRLAEPADQPSLSVIIDGTDRDTITIPRKAGATKLVRRTLSSPISGDLVLLLALRVDDAAAAMPPTLLVGPTDDGKTVAAKGAGRILISLPGNATTGFAWSIRSIEGTSVEKIGDVQYTPGGPAIGAGGTFEAALRPVAKGTAKVTLEYRRSWEEKPAEKAFQVTIDVQELPATAPASRPAGN